MLQAAAKTSGSLNQCLHKKFLNNEMIRVSKDTLNSISQFLHLENLTQIHN
jgi:hypothetical protein